MIMRSKGASKLEPEFVKSCTYVADRRIRAAEILPGERLYLAREGAEHRSVLDR